MIETPLVPPGYRLVDGPPAVADYVTLRLRSGLSPRRSDQAAAAVRGSWAAVHVLHDESGGTVGMGRVLGDGGWYFTSSTSLSCPSISVTVSAMPSSARCWTQSGSMRPREHTSTYWQIRQADGCIRSTASATPRQLLWAWR